LGFAPNARGRGQVIDLHWEVLIRLLGKISEPIATVKKRTKEDFIPNGFRDSGSK
jgi:hypothetical protein